MRNESHARVLGVGTIILNSVKTMMLKNVQHVPSIKLFLSLINVYCLNMEHLLEKAMIAEPCSVYLCMTHIISL
jgi:hypothetical protein